MNEKMILELHSVAKTFSDFRLDDISFSLPYGAIMGFVGENGAGKTTTIKSILKMTKIEKGEIILFNNKISDEIELKNKIGVVFDSNTFSGNLTPKIISKIMDHIYRQWNNGEFLNYLQKFDLPLNRCVGTFSKGMLMKLSLSVALSHASELLILDEVTAGLDPIVRDDVLDTLMNFIQSERHSVLLSSHITSDLEKIADYITFIHRGRILLSLSKEEMKNNYAVVRCRKEQFSGIDSQDMMAYLKREYQIDVLVPDINSFRSKYTGMMFDTATIDDILAILVRGKRV